MADLMQELQSALTDLGAKKKVLDLASDAVTKASVDYDSAKQNVIKLRLEVNKLLDHQLEEVGVISADSRVRQSE